MPGPSGFLPGVGRPAAEPSQDKGYKRLKRASDFPYDMPVLTGGARGIDNMGGGFVDMSQQHSHPLIPKDISHGPWDEETGELEQEASNFPGLLSKSSDSGMGGTVPGTAGGWANSPMSWDAEDEVERAGSRHVRESAWDLLEGLGTDCPSREEMSAALLSAFDDRAPRRRTSLLQVLIPDEDEIDADARDGGGHDMYRWHEIGTEE